MDAFAKEAEHLREKAERAMKLAYHLRKASLVSFFHEWDKKGIGDEHEWKACMETRFGHDMCRFDAIDRKFWLVRHFIPVNSAVAYIMTGGCRLGWEPFGYDAGELWATDPECVRKRNVIGSMFVCRRCVVEWCLWARPMVTADVVQDAPGEV